MNPPYNAKPINIPDYYKSKWDKKTKDSKEDPTKGLVFVRFFSDVIKELNENRVKNGNQPKLVKLAVLLPLACAIGTGSLIKQEKEILKKNLGRVEQFTKDESGNFTLSKWKEIEGE